ncbi:MAG TPA: peptidylprolyl isomerase [Gemmatimonadaceae bacterium]|jgi:peptidyl-prolyl cis-trans isomerase A (cyclophilin A)
MRLRHFALFALAVAPLTASHAQARQRAAGIVNVIIETDRGTIHAALDSAHAPHTVANFLKYVDGGFYNDGRFHRSVTPANQPRDSVRIEVIQGGANPARETQGFPPIELERTSQTGLRHLDGSLSMARGGPNTATSDFFICIGAQPSLDFGGHRNLDGQGFAAFGHVTSGVEIVRAIQKSAVEEQRLTPPVMIKRIARE